ncbi:MAG: heme ABC exporter ATP-binding protein CcmA [Chloroflexi bacterium]|nr:heme ABC exporter ATP-binding protein CcmA [Chloroflexota bacterium]
MDTKSATLHQDNTSASPALEVRGLVKSYGAHLALKGIDLVLPWGQALAMFGPNGSGKTTLIKVLATLARPTEGQVRIAGLDQRRHAALARRLIGVVGHNTFLYDDLTARENLRFYARMFGVTKPDERIAGLGEALGLALHLDRRVRTLSHGLQKRVGIARALLHDPSLLLLDEPETGLDPEAAALLESLLRRHLERGGSLVFTTHSVERGLAIASRVAVLREGRIAYTEERASLDVQAFQELYQRFTRVGP